LIFIFLAEEIDGIDDIIVDIYDVFAIELE
jgi:hypothetical protein